MLAGLVAITAPCAFVDPVGGGADRRHRRRPRGLQRVLLREPRHRRSGRRDLGARRERALGRALASASSPTGSTAPAGTASCATRWSSSTAPTACAASSTATPRSSCAQMPRRAWSWRCSASCMAYVWFKFSDMITPMRVPEEVELEGLDIPEVGALGLPRLLDAHRRAQPVGLSDGLRYHAARGPRPGYPDAARGVCEGGTQRGCRQGRGPWLDGGRPFRAAGGPPQPEARRSWESGCSVRPAGFDPALFGSPGTHVLGRRPRFELSTGPINGACVLAANSTAAIACDEALPAEGRSGAARARAGFPGRALVLPCDPKRSRRRVPTYVRLSGTSHCARAGGPNRCWPCRHGPGRRATVFPSPARRSGVRRTFG